MEYMWQEKKLKLMREQNKNWASIFSIQMDAMMQYVINENRTEKNKDVTTKSKTAAGENIKIIINSSVVSTLFLRDKSR